MAYSSHISCIACSAYLLRNSKLKLLYSVLLDCYIEFCRQNSILIMDDSALDIDQVDNLIKFSPTKEEMELLKVFLYFLVICLFYTSTLHPIDFYNHGN